MKKTSKKKCLTTGSESQPRSLGTERLERVFTTQEQQKKCLIENPQNLDVKSNPDDVKMHIQARQSVNVPKGGEAECECAQGRGQA